MLNEFVARCEILEMMQQMWGLTIAQGNVIIYLSHSNGHFNSSTDAFNHLPSLAH